MIDIFRPLYLARMINPQVEFDGCDRAISSPTVDLWGVIELVSPTNKAIIIGETNLFCIMVGKQACIKHWGFFCMACARVSRWVQLYQITIQGLIKDLKWPRLAQTAIHICTLYKTHALQKLHKAATLHNPCLKTRRQTLTRGNPLGEIGQWRSDFPLTVVLINMKNKFVDWFKQFRVMYYLEIQGLFMTSSQIQGLFNTVRTL